MEEPCDAKLFACWLLSQYNGTHIYSGAEIVVNYHLYARFYQRFALTQNAITRILTYGKAKEKGWFCNTRMGSKNAYKFTLNDEIREMINKDYKLYDRTKARWNDKENGIEYY